MNLTYLHQKQSTHVWRPDTLMKAAIVTRYGLPDVVKMIEGNPGSELRETVKESECPLRKWMSA